MITNRKLYEKADELVHDIFRLTEKVKDLTEQIHYLEKTVRRLYGIQTEQIHYLEKTVRRLYGIQTRTMTAIYFAESFAATLCGVGALHILSARIIGGLCGKRQRITSSRKDCYEIA